MPTLKPATFLCFALLIATIALSGCTLPALRPLEEVTITLEPEKSASIFAMARSDRFGVCTGVPRGGTRLYLWGEFLRQMEEVTRYDLQYMAGYEVHVNRGESCHERILNAFQAAAYFDVSTLPSMAVTSARLRIDRPFSPRDPPFRGTNQQCNVMMIGEATESWEAGLHEGVPFISWRAARRDAGPHRATLTGILDLDVTNTVGAWVREQRSNEGFVITPDMDAVTDFFNATDQRGYMCDMGIGDVELVVTVAVAR